MRIENDKITDSIIMLCVFKGLCCIIVKLIVKLSPLGQSPSNISSKVEQTRVGEVDTEDPATTSALPLNDKHHKELLFLYLVHSITCAQNT